MFEGGFAKSWNFCKSPLELDLQVHHPVGQARARLLGGLELLLEVLALVLRHGELLVETWTTACVFHA